jgi:hypothetical protein
VVELLKDGNLGVKAHLMMLEELLGNFGRNMTSSPMMDTFALNEFTSLSAIVDFKRFAMDVHSGLFMHVTRVPFLMLDLLD